jgi:hypothetical protein
MLRHVTLVITDVSEERISIITVKRIGELGTTLAVTSNRSTPGERVAGIHWRGGWMGPSVCLDDVGRSVAKELL